MTLDFGTVSKNNNEVRESPLIWLQGVDTNFSLQVDGTGTLANATMVLYENNSDVSSTKLTGSLSIPSGGRTIVSKTLQNLVGGSYYRWYIYFTDSGIANVREGSIIVPKLGVSPSRTYPSAIDRFKIAESPVLMYPSQSLSAVLVIDGEGEIGNSPTMVIYKKTSDDSSNVLSDDLTVTGRLIALKTIGNLSGGFEYIVYVYFTDNGKNTARYFEIICQKLGV